MKNFEAHISQFVGAHVEHIDRAGVIQRLVVQGPHQTIGTMKDGVKAPYVLLADEQAHTTIPLHPEHAKRLFNKGSDSGFKMLTDLTTPAPVALKVVDPFNLLPQTPDEVMIIKAADEQINAEMAAVDVALGLSLAFASLAAQTAPSAPVTSKKALFMALFTRMHAEGKTRAEIKVEALKIGLSDAGFNTYYQNAKSGQWA